MSTVDSTIQLGEIFLETADGTKISIGQLKAPFNITIEQPKAESPAENKAPAEIKTTVPLVSPLEAHGL